MLLSGLLVVHNTSRSGENNVTKLSGRQKSGDPLLNLVDTDIKARRNDSSLVQTTSELDNNLASSVIIDILEFSNVA